MITLHDVEQGSPLWHQLRDPRYTGSHGDKVLKFGTIEYSRAESQFGGNFWTERGHVLEAEAIEIYQQITESVGIRLESGRKVGFVTNSKYPECGYSPDDFYPDHTVEVKSFDEVEHMKLINAKTVHDIDFKILAQIHFGLLITEKPYCHLLPYNPKFSRKELPDGSPNPNYDVLKAFKIITIKANPKIKANFRRILAANRKEAPHAFSS